MNLRALLFALCILSSPFSVGAAPPPIEAFFANRTMSGATPSPDGRLLAVRHTAAGKRVALVVYELSTMTPKVAASFADIDIRRFQWVNNERLVFDTTDREAARGEIDRAPGIFSVKFDGSELRQLASRDGQSGVVALRSKLEVPLLPWHTFLLDEPGAQDSDEIHVINTTTNIASHTNTTNLLVLNTVTGKSRPVKGPPISVTEWMFDQRGQLRLAIGMDNEKYSIFYLDPDTAAWRELAAKTAYTESEKDLGPLGFGPDGTLYVRARAGNDKLALYTYDFKMGKVHPTPLVSLKDFDFTGTLIRTQDKLLGVDFLADAQSTEWFDPHMKAVQAEVDKLLPNTVNTLEVGVRHRTPWVLVNVRSDRTPLTFLLYNTTDKTLTRIGETRPDIRPEQMSARQLVRYKARDGLEIPAWLTVPKGAGKNLPMVVLVHDGPRLRGGDWSWDADSQFLASRGYLVLEPEFRGSFGYGLAHYRAGFKQWGLKMQDDLADGTRWAIARGLADPARICIAGAGYGGYATFMGLINDPQLYRCGVASAGITDMKLLYAPNWRLYSGYADHWRKYGMPELVGDPVRDAAQLEATSPLTQAARLKQPVLLAYGGEDLLVPLVHGTRFRDALTRTNPSVEWIEYPQEAHDWRLVKTKVDFWSRVERFLDRQIGPAAAPVSAPP